jgi:hypothetical protein
MLSRRALASAVPLLACVPSIVLAIVTGMMKISHGDVWGRHNRSFLLLFIVVFALIFVPVTMRSKAEHGASIKRLLRRETIHLALGAALGYLASLLAYAGVIILARISGASQAPGDRSDALNTAAVLLLNNYGWLFGSISFVIFDLLRALLQTTLESRGASL